MTDLAQVLIEEGIEQGIQQGLERGQLEGKRSSVRRIVEKRFGALPPALETRLNEASLETLDALIDRALTAERIEELEQFLQAPLRCL